MTAFEKMMPFLVLALLLGSAAVLFFALRVERRLMGRRQVTLANYRQKNYLFYITRDIPVAVVSAALGACSLVFLVILLFQPAIRIYAVVLAMLVLLNGACLYLSLSRRKFTRDIRVFDAYYVQVADLLANKERTQEDIRICEQRVSDLRAKLEQTVAGFNQNLLKPISAAFLPSLFAPVETMLRDYNVEIEHFSGAVEQDFNQALSAFLLEEREPELHVVPLRAFDEVAADDLLAQIKTSYGTQIAVLVIERVNDGAVASAKALGNVMVLLHELGVRVEDETLVRFLRAAAAFHDRAVLAAMLYENKQIPAALVREVMIPEDWSWCFVPGMVASFNTRELSAILTQLLSSDSAELCYMFLSQFDASLSSVLEEALRVENERAAGAAPNAATKQAQAFRLILGNEYAVGNAASIFENLAMMVFERRTEIGLSPEEQARIVEIVHDEAFMEARREIGAFYHRAAQSGKSLVESSMRVMLQYVMDAPTDESFLDTKRLVALLGEYRFTLSFGDLGVLRALVAGYLLCTSSERRVLDAVLSELAALPVSDVQSEGFGRENAADYGRAILTHLAQKERVRLRSAIYRTESRRLTLDCVLALCRKGA